MKSPRYIHRFLLALALCLTTAHAASEKTALVIHGGAGTILKENMSEAQEKAFREALLSALNAGHKRLKAGDSSLEAIQAAIVSMEDSPLFNAGRGAVFTHEGTNELDASVMDGSTLDSGAVAGVSGVKNPILLATRVMTQSPHVMLSGRGALTFAKSQNLEIVNAKYFHTERRWQQLQKRLEAEKAGKKEKDFTWYDAERRSKFGTVGAVALDKKGNIAAGTSTGGMTNKRWGRIGDSPIIGAGTYAENGVCGVSATGHGEYFIRAAVAHDICARVKYGQMSIQDAADAVIQQKLPKMGGSGGVIALGGEGQIVMSFNTTGMYRAAVNSDGEITIRIYKDP